MKQLAPLNDWEFKQLVGHASTAYLACAMRSCPLKDTAETKRWENLVAKFATAEGVNVFKTPAKDRTE